MKEAYLNAVHITNQYQYYILKHLSILHLKTFITIKVRLYIVQSKTCLIVTLKHII